MDESTWDNSNDPGLMLDFLRGRASDRKLRLFACALWRHNSHLLPNPELENVLDTAEAFADGLLPRSELAPLRGVALGVAAGRAATAAREAIWAVRLRTYRQRYGGQSWEQTAWEAVTQEVGQQACALLRDLFGPLPFRTLAIDLSWLQWQEATVVSLARAIYEEGNGTDLPILGDALEEAGCEDQAILNHCRLGGPHRKGCWVVDLFQGKE